MTHVSVGITVSPLATVLALSLSNRFFQPGTMASVPYLARLSLALSRYNI